MSTREEEADAKEKRYINSYIIIIIITTKLQQLL